MAGLGVPVIQVDFDEGFADLDLVDGQPDPAEGLALLWLRCPGRLIRSSVGGQTFTPCSFCGELMASTVGPHSDDGRWAKAVVITNVSEGLVFWRPVAEADMEDGA